MEGLSDDLDKEFVFEETHSDYVQIVNETMKKM
jgi:hypothetical protein